ncbi:MAG: right-handed parallel beta-helix repeat-containing protein [Clostridia bacterium]|nr:right-handed parallel beta-helix repeat-containing protein [Clostridia bacterium]
MNDKTNKYLILLYADIVAAALSCALFFFAFVKWIIPFYGISVALFAVTAFIALFCLFRLRGLPGKKAVLRAVIFTAVHMAVIEIATVVINNVILKGVKPRIAAITVTGITFVFFLITGIAASPRGAGRRGVKAVIAAALALLIPAGAAAVGASGFIRENYQVFYKPITAPAGFSESTQENKEMISDADFYVSETGDDSDDGSFGRPFLTLEKARDAVRALDKTGRTGVTVAIMAGEYRTGGLVLTEEDSGTPECPIVYTAYGDGEVILNGGVTVDSADFKPVSDQAVLDRLSPEAREKVVCADIRALGITAEDYGKIYTIGSYNTASHYDGDYVGPIYSELFVNDNRCSLARYPDEGWLKTGDVVKMGHGRESDGSKTRDDNWDNIRNPESDVYKVDKDLAERINSWQTLEDVWMFGFFKYTWADASSPIGTFDFEKREISPKFVSVYGAIKGAPYYFFNILEELSAPGEWYLDRENGIVYLYPDGDLNGAVIDMTLSCDPVIQADGVGNVAFEGITVMGTRGDGIVINGDSCTVRNCLIKNIAGTAIIMNGSDNLAYGNEITRTGKAGISINGGDRQTLTPGNSRAENNLIHDWSEIYMTYQAAVSLGGVGNVCAHNEIYNSPHEAITYGGNSHVIEYNLIHDVCLLSDDAGAIYAGRSWSMYGNIIRYNAVYNLGTPGEHSPQGIYMDDALSGQTIYGNLLVNVPCDGLALGGGRDLNVRNNVVINTGSKGVSFDERAIDGVLNDGWFDHCDQMWDELNTFDWQTGAWLSAYPEYAGLHYDKSITDDPMFAANAAKGALTGNVFVNFAGKIGDIASNPEKYSDISGNAVYKLSKLGDLFTDPDNGDYSLKENSPILKDIPGFEEIPVGEIGIKCAMCN